MKKRKVERVKGFSMLKIKITYGKVSISQEIDTDLLAMIPLRPQKIRFILRELGRTLDQSRLWRKTNDTNN